MGFIMPDLKEFKIFTVRVGVPRRQLSGRVRQPIFLQIGEEEKKFVLRGKQEDVAASVGLIKKVAEYEAYARDHAENSDAVTRAGAAIRRAEAGMLRMALAQRPYRIVLPD